ncbi:MAG: cytochrome c biogenesis protein CcdA, partial [Cloacibacterium sp.]
MKKFLLLLFIAVTSLFSAQIQKHVTIKYDVKSLPNNEYEAVITANIDKGWHIYSKDIDPESGAIPTELKLNSKDIQLIGKPVETGSRKTEFSEAFGTDLIFLSGNVTIKQKFKLKNPEKPANVIAEFTYQTCDDRVCLAPESLEFEKTIAGSAVVKTEENKEDVQNADSAKSIAATIPLTTENTEIAPQQEGLKVSSLDFENPLTDCGVAKEKKSENYLTYLFLGFLGGLIALLTPCVFPMIPLTVSFFTKGQKDKAKGKRDAFIYGFFILLIFVLLSVPFHIIDGIAGNIFNQISTSVSLNIAFFLIFLFFAGSFFGYYDITLPSSIANKSSKAEEAGGIIGIFFMALTLVIVSFSCTGPILGSLLGSAVTGSANVPMLLTFALAGFGLSWAIVFGLLALFPQALQSLPKSGGWMNT